MHLPSLIKALGLPQLKVLDATPIRGFAYAFRCETTSSDAVCVHCGKLTSKVHARETIRVRDEGLRRGSVLLVIEKKRFRCVPCQKTFNESIPGIGKGARSTERFRKEIAQASQVFANRKSVATTFSVSTSWVVTISDRQRELERRKKVRPWPKRVGIDEHSFLRNRQTHFLDFVTILVDHGSGQLLDVADGRRLEDVAKVVNARPGAENVQVVTLDLSPAYRETVRALFRNASLVADKFHVHRLFGRYLNEVRLRDLGRKNRSRRAAVVHLPPSRLGDADRTTLEIVKLDFPEVGLAWDLKREIARMYRCNDRFQASRVLLGITDRLGHARQSPLATTLRATLLDWKTEILGYFTHRITNARCEGHNNRCKMIARRAYGYRTYASYRLAVTA